MCVSHAPVMLQDFFADLPDAIVVAMQGVPLIPTQDGRRAAVGGAQLRTVSDASLAALLEEPRLQVRETRCEAVM